MKKIALILFTSISIFCNAQVVINEYSCSNVSSYIDNFGNYEDWIELYNAGSTPVNLNGYYLSNKKTNITKWKLGNVTISANGFLRIWASGQDINTGTDLHTNFSLTQCKPDQIIFSNSSATVLDSLTLLRTKLAHSRGRTTNGSNTWSVFLNPTFGSSNNTATAYQSYATMPSMNVTPGFYTAAQTISISSPDANVTIHYTINGSTPSASSAVYSAPISISATTVLRAIAISSVSTIQPSFVTSNTYFINSPHTVAVVSIFGDQVTQLLNGNMTTPEAGVQYFDSSGTFRTQGYGTSNKHGNDSWNYPQRGIDFVTYDQYGYNDVLKNRLFNSKTRTEFQHIILKAAANDNYPFECPVAGNPNALGDPTLFDAAHIRDAYVETVAQKAGMHLDIRTWAACVLYVNGKYWGVYDLREKVDDKDFTKYYYNSSSDSLQMLQNWGGVWAAYGGNQALTDWNTMKNYITNNNMAVQANYNYVDSLFSIKSFVDYVLINSYCVTSDWMNWNSEWWRGINANCSKQKWRYCLWDEDATFHHYINYTGIPNNNANASPCDPQTLNPNPPDFGGNIDILNALMHNTNFQQYYVLRYFDLINTGLSCNRMTQILDSMIQVIAPEMPGQVAKWGGSVTAWQQNVSDLRNFILQRCDSISHQFNGCYNVTGPYIIKVNVDPPGSGTVDVNTIHLTNFVWSALYPGNIPVALAEQPSAGYCFSHWEFKNNTPLPNTTDSAVTVNLLTTDSIVAHFVLNPVPQITPVNPKICAGDTVRLNATQGNNFVWSPANSLSCSHCVNPLAHPNVTTIYTVTSTNATGCTNKNTQLVTVIPSAIAGFNDTIMNAGLPQSVVFTNTSSSANNYLWNFGNGNTSTTANPTYSYTVAGTYTITLISYANSNCNDTVSKFIVITDTAFIANLVMPNVFSPNGDGTNDFFTPKATGITQYECTIVDRWGLKLFESNSLLNNWNGQNKGGTSCAEGTYFYIVKAKDIAGKDYALKGFLTLVR